METLDRRRLAAVEWRDLLDVGPGAAAWEVTLSLPWLLASVAAAHTGWVLLALPLSFVFYLTGLRQVHGAFHHSTGLPRWGDHAMMLGLSGLMLGSMHAIRLTHLRHHHHCLDDDDVEGHAARVAPWRAILIGPVFPVRLHRAAWRAGDRSDRRWLAAELGLTVGLVAAASVGPAWLAYHVGAMAIGHCLTAFFAVWTVHHDCDRAGLFARTMRGALRSRATWHMFYHLEHHLFPAVPTRHLARLATRVDRVMPGLDRKRVI